jgi:hypothetical protein
MSFVWVHLAFVDFFPTGLPEKFPKDFIGDCIIYGILEIAKDFREYPLKSNKHLEPHCVKTWKTKFGKRVDLLSQKVIKAFVGKARFGIQKN